VESAQVQIAAAEQVTDRARAEAQDAAQAADAVREVQRGGPVGRLPAPGGHGGAG
jgi:hypothetical protein